MCSPRDEGLDVQAEALHHDLLTIASSLESDMQLRLSLARSRWQALNYLTRRIPHLPVVMREGKYQSLVGAMWL